MRRREFISLLGGAAATWPFAARAQQPDRARRERDMMLKRAQNALFKQVRRYANQLEKLDPDSHNAAQEIGNVVLTLSHTDTAQERLDALTSEARRLIVAVAEAKSQLVKSTELPTNFERFAPYARGLFYAVVWVAGTILFVLFAEGG